MTRSLGSPLSAWPSMGLTIGLTISLAGCAASPIGESDRSEQPDADGGWRASEAPATQDDGDDAHEPGIDPNADLNGGAASTPGAMSAPKPDAGADAGSAALDAGRTDAGTQDAAVKDAAIAAIADAGRGTPAPVDSGTATPAPARDAGPSTPKPGSCRSAADCTTSCVPIGILNCCRDNGTCGCTWAPGAYCS